MLLASAALAQDSGQNDPQAYLDRAIAEFETKHINRDGMDWPKVRAEARGADTPADTYPAIRMVIDRLGERHTVLIPAPPPAAERAPRPPASATVAPIVIPRPEGRLVDGRWGYLKIPSFMSRRESTYSHDFTMQVRDILKAHDAAGIGGWIIDLRGNGGGNIWPMIDGLLPLLGEPPYSSHETDRVARVIRKGGRFYQEGAAELPPLDDVQLKSAGAPIAILIDGATASSAEGIAIAFKGLPNVRYFGETTRDLVSVNNPVTLSDGARITMTVGYSRDRAGTLWTGPIEPDEKVGGEAAEAVATAWLARAGQ